MNDSIALRFNAKTLDYIAQVLAQRPFAEVAAILTDIQQQVSAQQNGPAVGPVEGGEGATPVAGAGVRPGPL